MYLFSKARFNAAVSRLRDALPFKSLVNDVCHQLEKDGVSALAESVRLHFEQNKPNRNIDRKRAENALSRALSGEDYNVTSAKLKALDNNATSITDIMMHHAHELKNTCYSLTEGGQQQHRTIAANIKSIVERFAHYPMTLSDFNFNNDNNSTPDLLALIGSLFNTFGIRTITTSGASDVIADTMEGGDVDIDIYITFDNSLNTELHLNFVAEKLMGDINNITTTLYIDGKSAEYFVELGDTENIDRAFYDLGRYMCISPAEADLVDLNEPYYQAIAEFVIPAMQFSASKR